MKLKIKRDYDNILVVNMDDIEVFNDWSGRVVRKPRTMGQVCLGIARACCGVEELSSFYFDRGLTEAQRRQVSRKLSSYLVSKFNSSRDKSSFVFAVFRRNHNQEEYDHHEFYQAFLASGWKKLGKEFVNRRYPTKNSQHVLQTLVYLSQPLKKGNSYVEAADAV